MPNEAPTPPPASIWRRLGSGFLRLLGLAAAVILYLGAAKLMAILAVRVGADLIEGIDPLLSTDRRPNIGAASLARRELAADILLQVNLVLLVLLTVIWRHGSGWRERLALDRTRPNGMRARHLLLVLLLWPILHITWVTGTAEAFGATFAQGVKLSPTLSAASVAAWLAYVVIVAPAAEELLIRGEIFAQARGFLPPALAILVTALLFALAHISAWGLARPVSLLPLALMLGWLRWRTGRLWPCIALHGWSNLALVAYVLWPAPG
ncbi:membrane protease YdiL (CAAX protease family) [Methylobacterium sp. BE186]|uniref:CPBP family intramembrane glutamic endopeptidase n=1 Tax=Methylobacterium sp. BE186 TaxID=2817715 RepID=UPI00285C99FC|nr:CPBP family intramembrane glutamic endopeptidase [Methylobacterium sp. BE186]MDR7038246.1 membrane protease YdiL (CAAX protease family) [Methylobacterium sp. BE186]